MSEEESPTLVLTIPKDRVRFDGEFAIIDIGLTVEEFIEAITKFAMSPKGVAVVKKKDAEGI